MSWMISFTYRLLLSEVCFHVLLILSPDNIVQWILLELGMIWMRRGSDGHYTTAVERYKETM